MLARLIDGCNFIQDYEMRARGVVLFSVKVRQKSLVSQHLHDAPKQIVIAEADDIIFEADPLKHFF